VADRQIGAARPSFQFPGQGDPPEGPGQRTLVVTARITAAPPIPSEAKDAGMPAGPNYFEDPMKEPVRTALVADARDPVREPRPWSSPTSISTLPPQAKGIPRAARPAEEIAAAAFRAHRDPTRPYKKQTTHKTHTTTPPPQILEGRMPRQRTSRAQRVARSSFSSEGLPADVVIRSLSPYLDARAKRVPATGTTARPSPYAYDSLGADVCFAGLGSQPGRYTQRFSLRLDKPRPTLRGHPRRPPAPAGPLRGNPSHAPRSTPETQPQTGSSLLFSIRVVTTRTGAGVRKAANRGPSLLGGTTRLYVCGRPQIPQNLESAETVWKS